jgi:hypothetical protein
MGLFKQNYQTLNQIKHLSDEYFHVLSRLLLADWTFVTFIIRVALFTGD